VSGVFVQADQPEIEGALPAIAGDFELFQVTDSVAHLQPACRLVQAG
jgi:hypothetical protein